MNAYIVVKESIKKIGLNELSNSPKKLYNEGENHESCYNIYYLLNKLKEWKFHIHLINWIDYPYETFKRDDLLIVPQWYITGSKYPIKVEERTKFWEQTTFIMNNKVNIILLHRSDYLFPNIEEIKNKGLKTGMRNRQISYIRVNKNINKLTDGVKNFINSYNFNRDYFERLAIDTAQIKPIIIKFPQGYENERYLTLGYYQYESGTKQIHLSVGFVGDNPVQTSFHNLLLNNILNFMYC